MTKIKLSPGAYWFGVSYKLDLAFAERLHGKRRRQFIEAIKKYWRL